MEPDLQELPAILVTDNEEDAFAELDDDINTFQNAEEEATIDENDLLLDDDIDQTPSVVSQVDRSPRFYEEPKYLINLSRYQASTNEKIASSLPEQNDPKWPQEDLNKLKNIRGSKITLSKLITSEIEIFALFRLE